MMTNNAGKNALVNNTLNYYDWLRIVCFNHSKYSSDMYSIVLYKLYSTKFVYTLRMDENRYIDGINLRGRFLKEIDSSDISLVINYLPRELNGGCSMLEMMAALSIKCEEEIMSDEKIGDRTSMWFFSMLRNTGLYKYTDNYISCNENSINEITSIIDNVINRRYSRDGTGGLFKTNDGTDMVSTDIWYQMCRYLSNFS